MTIRFNGYVRERVGIGMGRVRVTIVACDANRLLAPLFVDADVSEAGTYGHGMEVEIAITPTGRGKE